MTIVNFSILPAMIFLFPITAYSQELPRSGVVHNVEKKSQLVYNCTEIHPMRISCKMRESEVSLMSDPNDLEAKIENALEDMRAGEELEEVVKTACEAVTFFGSNMNLNADAQAKLEDMSQSQRADLENTIDKFSTICREQNEESVRQLIEIMAVKETRTCQVNTRSWDQEFNLVSDDVWVASNDESHLSSCGLISLDRIQKSESGYFWDYVSKIIASNPNSTFFGVELCSERFNGEETNYTYFGDSFPIECDYIKFGITH